MIAVSAGGQAEVIGQPPEAQIAAAWALLTNGNVACGCCASDAEYVSRVNEVGMILGKPPWNGRISR